MLEREKLIKVSFNNGDTEYYPMDKVRVEYIEREDGIEMYELEVTKMIKERLFQEEQHNMEGIN